MLWIFLGPLEQLGPQHFHVFRILLKIEGAVKRILHGLQVTG